MLAVFDHPHFFAHTPFANHPTSDRRSHFDVATRAVCYVAEDDVLGHAAAHAHGKTSQQFVFAVGVFIFLGQPHGRSKRWPARDDRDFVQRLSVRQKFKQQRVTGFMVRGVLLFFFAERKAPTLFAPANFVARFLELGQRDSL